MSNATKATNGRHADVAKDISGGRTPNPRSKTAAPASDTVRRDCQPSTDAGMWLGLVAAVVLTGAFYAALWPFRQAWIGNLFFKTGSGGWVPPTLMLFSTWSMWILLVKWSTAYTRSSIGDAPTGRLRF